jgi:hypothetical protein
VLLALVVLIDVTQAGRRYVYCSGMQEVMQHACCAQHHASTSTPTLRASGPECCQERVVPELEAWASFQRSVFLPAAPLLALAVQPLLLPIATILRPEQPAIRSGPPLLRVLARLMVFRL